MNTKKTRLKHELTQLNHPPPPPWPENIIENDGQNSVKLGTRAVDDVDGGKIADIF